MCMEHTGEGKDQRSWTAKDGEEMASQVYGLERGQQSEFRVEIGKASSVQIMKGPVTQVGDFKPRQGRVVHVRTSAGQGYCCR